MLGNGAFGQAVPVSQAQTAAPSPPLTPPPGVAINNPPLAPHQILVFTQRSFVSASGYGANDVVRVDVIHRFTGTIVSSQDIIPQDDPATPVFDGIVEVNHPGGGCWLNFTPDIRAGDRVRTTALDTVTGAVTIDETTVQDVTAQLATDKAPNGTPLPPGTVQVHGTAQDFNAPGTPLDIVALEQRLVIPGDLFDVNGRRTLRATSPASDGVLAYDAPGSIHWTATYTGLSGLDISRALGADSRIIWLGTNQTGFVENTFFENGTGIVGGPAAPCTAPAEPGAVASTTPAALTFANQQVGSTSVAQTVTLSNTGTLPMTVSSVSLSNLNPGDFTLGANTCAGAVVAAGKSCSVAVSFAPTATGARSAMLVFQDDAPGIVHTVTLSGNGTPAPQGAASLSPASLSFAPQQVGTSSAPQNVTLTNTGAGALAVGSITSSSGDFLLSANLCSGKTLNPGQNCVVSVVFKPAAQGASTGSLSFTDSAPNSPQSLALSGNGVVVQLTAPSKPALAAASDSGTKGDGITNVNTPTFTGTATTGTSVNILSDGVKVGSGPITAGAYSVTTGLLADGAHVIVAQAVDAAGNVSPNSAALNVTIDTVAPVATAPVMTMAAGSAVTINATNFANSTVPVTLTWSATDAVGATSYQLQQKKDTLNGTITTTGTFTDVSPAPTGTKVTLDLALGQLLLGRPIVLNSYTFQVRACDAAGNCSAFAAAPKFQMLPVDDSLTGPLLNGAGSVAYSGSWTTGAVAGAYNGSVHFTTATGANAKLTNVTYNVTADVVWIATKGPDRGIATVTVDGVATTVDLYAPTVQAAQVVFASNGLRGGAQHTVQVTATGTRNAASTGVRVDLDGFAAIR